MGREESRGRGLTVVGVGGKAEPAFSVDPLSRFADRSDFGPRYLA